MHTKVTKRKILEYFAKWKLVTTFNLMLHFGFSYSGAWSRLYRLRKRQLIESEISPDGKTKNWFLTELGWDRLRHYREREGEG